MKEETNIIIISNSDLTCKALSSICIQNHKICKIKEHYIPSCNDLVNILKDEVYCKSSIVLINWKLFKSGTNSLTKEEIYNSAFKNVRLLIIVDSDTDYQEIIKLMDIGFHGIISLNCPCSEFTKAINSVLDSQNYYCEYSSQKLMEELGKSNLYKTIEQIKLTNREKEILALICKGLSYRQIAEKLFISEETVESHRKNLFKKIDVDRSTQLILKAKEYGLVNY